MKVRLLEHSAHPQTNAPASLAVVAAAAGALAFPNSLNGGRKRRLCQASANRHSPLGAEVTVGNSAATTVLGGSVGSACEPALFPPSF